MIHEFNQAVSKMDELKAELQVLLPVLQAARAELGEERANQLIFNALRAWGQERFRCIGESMPGNPKEKWERYEKQNMSRMGTNDLDFVMLRQDSEAVEYNVTRCIYADLFRELAEPELGVVLVCNQDYYVAEGLCNPDVEYKRTHSIMEGGNFCDIHWSIKKSLVSE